MGFEIKGASPFPRACASLLLSLAVVLTFASCGMEPPEIISSEWRIESRPAQQGGYESLSVFVNAKGSDPSSDIESMVVVNEAAGLSWRIDDLNWTLQKAGNDTWIGAADLAQADYKPLPRGEYDLVITNLAGQRAETSFRFPEKPARYPAPVLASSAGKLKIESSWPQSFLLCYDASGVLVNAREIAAGSYEAAGLFKTPPLERVASFAVYGYDSRQHCGAYSWRVTR